MGPIASLVAQIAVHVVSEIVLRLGKKLLQRRPPVIKPKPVPRRRKAG